jgi:hypothetical protein
MAVLKLNNVTTLIESSGATSLVLTPSSAPSGPVEGQMYYNSTTKVVYVYNGSVWENLTNVSIGNAKATGGEGASYSSGGVTYMSHTFLISGTFTPQSSFNVDYLIVGGGGGGGSDSSSSGGFGGGGAGGFLTATSFGVTAQSYSIVIGTGGGHSFATANNADNGDDTTALGLTAYGGGGGGGSGTGGYDGGSGGGGGYNNNVGGDAVASGAQGNDGGDAGTANLRGGGGGGAGAAGANYGAHGTGGIGGIGLTNIYRTGLAVYYAGGGGSGDDAYWATGGLGGGGRGGGNLSGTSRHVAEYGAPNTGGGGGGSGRDGGYGYGGYGGSGIVIIRYAI